MYVKFVFDLFKCACFRVNFHLEMYINLLSFEIFLSLIVIKSKLSIFC